MKIYVAGSLADIEGAQAVQTAVVAAGHELTLDWTRGPDASLTGFDQAPEASAERAQRGDLAHVIVVGAIRHESVFYFHPCVRRVGHIDE